MVAPEAVAAGVEAIEAEAQVANAEREAEGDPATSDDTETVPVELVSWEVAQNRLDHERAVTAEQLTE